MSRIYKYVLSDSVYAIVIHIKSNSSNQIGFTAAKSVFTISISKHSSVV